MVNIEWGEFMELSKLLILHLIFIGICLIESDVFAAEPTTSLNSNPTINSPSVPDKNSIVESNKIENPSNKTKSINLNTKKSNSAFNQEDSNSIKAETKRGSAINGLNPEAAGPESLFADEKGFLAGLDYPELQVVPRASERLQMEAQDEKASFMSNYWPVQLSSLGLVLAGFMSSGKYLEESPTLNQKQENQIATQMGILIGGVWVGTTYYLDHSLSYSKAMPEIKKINGKDKKSLLLKERLSEEALERSAKVAGMINNLSIWSNFLLAMYSSVHSKPGMPNYAGLAMGLSFLPWLIDNRMIENWQKHQEYKRKIYAPITRIDFMIDPNTQQATPLLGMLWRF